MICVVVPVHSNAMFVTNLDGAGTTGKSNIAQYNAKLVHSHYWHMLAEGLLVHACAGCEGAVQPL
jgi:hypothetical protein